MLLVPSNTFTSYGEVLVSCAAPPWPGIKEPHWLLGAPPPYPELGPHRSSRKRRRGDTVRILV